MENEIGKRTWAIPEGYIPPGSHGDEPEMTSHEAVCILNAGKLPAHVKITIFYNDRDPQGPYHFEVPAERTLHLRFNDFEPQIPRGTDYASTIVSDVPVIVQHTRLDSRQNANALLSTMAYGQ